MTDLFDELKNLTGEGDPNVPEEHKNLTKNIPIFIPPSDDRLQVLIDD